MSGPAALSASAHVHWAAAGWVLRRVLLVLLLGATVGGVVALTWAGNEASANNDPLIALYDPVLQSGLASLIVSGPVALTFLIVGVCLVGGFAWLGIALSPSAEEPASTAKPVARSIDTFARWSQDSRVHSSAIPARPRNEPCCGRCDSEMVHALRIACPLDTRSKTQASDAMEGLSPALLWGIALLLGVTLVCLTADALNAGRVGFVTLVPHTRNWIVFPAADVTIHAVFELPSVGTLFSLTVFTIYHFEVSGGLFSRITQLGMIASLITVGMRATACRGDWTVSAWDAYCALRGEEHGILLPIGMIILAVLHWTISSDWLAWCEARPGLAGGRSCHPRAPNWLVAMLRDCSLSPDDSAPPSATSGASVGDTPREKSDEFADAAGAGGSSNCCAPRIASRPRLVSLPSSARPVGQTAIISVLAPQDWSQGSWLASNTPPCSRERARNTCQRYLPILLVTGLVESCSEWFDTFIPHDASHLGVTLTAASIRETPLELYTVLTLGMLLQLIRQVGELLVLPTLVVSLQFLAESSAHFRQTSTAFRDKQEGFLRWVMHTLRQPVTAATYGIDTATVSLVKEVLRAEMDDIVAAASKASFRAALLETGGLSAARSILKQLAASERHPASDARPGVDLTESASVEDLLPRKERSASPARVPSVTLAAMAGGQRHPLLSEQKQLTIAEVPSDDDVSTPGTPASLRAYHDDVPTPAARVARERHRGDASLSPSRFSRGRSTNAGPASPSARVSRELVRGSSSSPTAAALGLSHELVRGSSSSPTAAASRYGQAASSTTATTKTAAAPGAGAAHDGQSSTTTTTTGAASGRHGQLTALGDGKFSSSPPSVGRALLRDASQSPTPEMTSQSHSDSGSIGAGGTITIDSVSGLHLMSGTDLHVDTRPLSASASHGMDTARSSKPDLMTPHSLLFASLARKAARVSSHLSEKRSNKQSDQDQDLVACDYPEQVQLWRLDLAASLLGQDPSVGRTDLGTQLAAARSMVDRFRNQNRVRRLARLVSIVRGLGSQLLDSDLQDSRLAGLMNTLSELTSASDAMLSTTHVLNRAVLVGRVSAGTFAISPRRCDGVELIHTFVRSILPVLRERHMDFVLRVNGARLLEVRHVPRGGSSFDTTERVVWDSGGHRFRQSVEARSESHPTGASYTRYVRDDSRLTPSPEGQLRRLSAPEPPQQQERVQTLSKVGSVPLSAAIGEALERGQSPARPFLVWNPVPPELLAAPDYPGVAPAQAEISQGDDSDAEDAPRPAPRSSVATTTTVFFVPTLAMIVDFANVRDSLLALTLAAMSHVDGISSLYVDLSIRPKDASPWSAPQTATEAAKFASRQGSRLHPNHPPSDSPLHSRTASGLVAVDEAPGAMAKATPSEPETVPLGNVALGAARLHQSSANVKTTVSVDHVMAQNLGGDSTVRGMVRPAVSSDEEALDPLARVSEARLGDKTDAILSATITADGLRYTDMLESLFKPFSLLLNTGKLHGSVAGLDLSLVIAKATAQLGRGDAGVAPGFMPTNSESPGHRRNHKRAYFFFETGCTLLKARPSIFPPSPTESTPPQFPRRAERPVSTDKVALEPFSVGSSRRTRVDDSPSRLSQGFQKQLDRLSLPAEGLEAIEAFLQESQTRSLLEGEPEVPTEPAAEPEKTPARLHQRSSVSLRSNSIEADEGSSRPPRSRPSASPIKERPNARAKAATASDTESRVVSLLLASAAVLPVDPVAVSEPWTIPGFPMPRILVVDDDRTVRHALCKLVVRTAQDINSGWHAAVQIDESCVRYRKLDDDGNWVLGPLTGDGTGRSTVEGTPRAIRAANRQERQTKRQMARLASETKQVISSKSAEAVPWMRRTDHHIMVVDRVVDGQFAIDKAKAMIESNRGPHEGPSAGVNFWDIVLLDLVMTNVDGITTARRLRQLGYTGVILGQTGNAVESDLARMREAGADDCLRKPVSKEDLSAFLVRAISNRFTQATESRPS
jgi:CheY-like chemotaxis protein